jgi:5-methylthioribose kinase
MTQADEAWSRFRADLEDLGRNLRTQADAEQLKRAADSVMESVNRVVQDPELREGTRRTARSLGEAMVATLNQIADSIRSQKRP